ncbi:MAG TPA: serine hydrolase domain-containing protein [Vicinamibacteria bacterium]|nr:serine hydrolase domain-containing protein [Vicinamibacteria bacterium]
MGLRPTIVSALLFGLAANVSGESPKIGDHPRVKTAIGLLEAWTDAKQAYEDIPGVSFAVVHDQELLWARGFGDAHRETKVPAATDTIYSICSISKLFTASAVLQLRDAGKLRLDDPVVEHLPWFDIEQTYQDTSPITIRGLLTHSAGLPRESDHPYWTFPDFEFPTREEIIERISHQKTLYPAERYFQYSNLGLTLAGETVTAVSGVPYAEYVERHLLEPLGMTDTTPEIPKKHEGGRFATGYSGRSRDGARTPLVFFQTRGIAPAAGFASTVEDLARFASWQFRLLEHGGEEILKASTLREMHRVHWVDPDWKTTWGLGYSVTRRDDKTFVGHGGSCPGFRSHLLLRPEERFAAIVMTNAVDVDAGIFTRIAYEIVAPALQEARESPDTPAPPDMTLYTGRYRSGFGGEIAVVPWKDTIAVVQLPSDDPKEGLVELKNVGAHVFRRIRDDGELGEEIVFDVVNEQVTRFTRHNNHYPKLP